MNSLNFTVLFLFNFSLCFLCWAIVFIISLKLRKLILRHNNPKRWSKKKYLILLTIMGLFGAIGLTFNQLKNVETKELDIVTSNPRALQIFTKVIGSNDSLTFTIRKEFWSIINQKRQLTDSEKKLLKEQVIELAPIYDKLLYEDALSSLLNKKIVKSIERSRMEDKYLLDHTFTSDSIVNKDIFISKIVNRNPVNLYGEEIVLDEKNIRSLIYSYDQTIRRVDTLLTEIR